MVDSLVCPHCSTPRPRWQVACPRCGSRDAPVRAPATEPFVGAVGVPGTPVAAAAVPAAAAPVAFAPPVTPFVAPPAALEPAAPGAPVAPVAPPAPVVPATPAAVPAPAGSAALVRDLATFGLVSAGACLGALSFFLPWAADGGIVLGGTHTGPGDRWGWAAPGTPWLLIVTIGVVLLALGGDRVERRFPRAAPLLLQLREIVLPIVLAGVYLGVAMLYFSQPFGWGSGVLLFFLGGALLFAGGLIALRFPTQPD